MVFRVFGFFAQQQILHIPHLALLQIPTNYPFYNIKGDECGIREGGEAVPCARTCRVLEFYHGILLPPLVFGRGLSTICRNQT